MIPINLDGKVALVTGVGDNESFAWYIAKALRAAGAKIVLASHPRMVGIVESFLSRDQDAPSRKLPHGGGDLRVEKVYACDVSYDTMADVPESVRTDRRYAKFADYSIQGTVDAVGKEFGGIDILIHSVAFSREIKNSLLNTSRAAYLEAISVSSYSLIGMLRAALPHMKNRPGASALGLTYLGGERVVPHYGGGMSTAKAALQIDAAQLAFFMGREAGVRVNLISAGPYASRAASAIGDIQKMIDYAAERSPLPRGITPEEVADATVFMCSALASGITAQTLYVDCGYHMMGG